MKDFAYDTDFLQKWCVQFHFYRRRRHKGNMWYFGEEGETFQEIYHQR